jgi:hypothetical protein
MDALPHDMQLGDDAGRTAGRQAVVAAIGATIETLHRLAARVPAER